MNSNRTQWSIVFSVALACAQLVGAQQPATKPSQLAPDAATLTRSQWLKEVGKAAKDPKAIREVMMQLSEGEKAEFTQRILKAITRMPLSPEEKQALLINASIECIRNTRIKNDERYKIIAEIIAVAPVEFLPGIIGDLSARFDPQLNKLSDEQFKAMADTTVKLAVERNKATDDPTVRSTFAMILFLKATKQPLTDDFLALLMTRLPDDASRELAKGYIAEAMKGNYEPLLTASGTTVRVIPPPPAVTRVGVSQVEQLLLDVGGLTGSLEGRTRNYGDTATYSGMNVFGATDVGIQTVPLGYPNQLDILP